MRVSNPHSWDQLRQEARSLGIRVVGQSTGALGDRLNSLDEKRRALLDEAQALTDSVKAAEDAGRKPKQGDLDRFEAIMNVDTGELYKVKAELEEVRQRVDQVKNLALERAEATTHDPFGRQVGSAAPATGKSGPVFRDENSGKTIRGLAADEPLFNAKDSVAAGDDRFDTPEKSLEAFALGLRGVIKGDVSTVRGAFTGGDDRGGFMVDSEISRAITDLARSQTVALRAGATTIPVDAAELSLVQVSEDPTSTWRPEFGRVQTSDVRFKRIVLRPKMLATIVPISWELLEDAVANVVDVITRAVSASMAVEIDRAILSGSGAESEPRGIRSHAGVNLVSNVGTPDEYAAITLAVRQILGANFAGDIGGLAWVMNPRDGATYDAMVDTTGQPLQPTRWASQLQQYSTTSLPTDLGAGSDESEMIVGDFKQAVLGVRSPIQVRMLEAGTVTDSSGNTINAVEQIAKFLIVQQRVDVGVIRPNHFTVLQGVTAS